VGRGLAFKRRARRKDHLVDFAALYAAEQRTGAQLIGTNAVQWRKSSVQHVIDTLIRTRTLDGCNVRRLFDYADEALIARGACAVSARIDIRHVVADGAEPQAGLEATHGFSQRGSIFVA